MCELYRIQSVHLQPSKLEHFVLKSHLFLSHSFLRKYHYTVYLKSITLAGQIPKNLEYNYNNGMFGTIIDSGTTSIVLSDTAYNAIKEEFRSWCTVNPSVQGCATFSTTKPLTGYCYSNIKYSPHTYAVLSPQYFITTCRDPK